MGASSASVVASCAPRDIRSSSSRRPSWQRTWLASRRVSKAHPASPSQPGAFTNSFPTISEEKRTHSAFDPTIKSPAERASTAKIPSPRSPVCRMATFAFWNDTHGNLIMASCALEVCKARKSYFPCSLSLTHCIICFALAPEACVRNGSSTRAASRNRPRPARASARRACSRAATTSSPLASSVAPSEDSASATASSKRRPRSSRSSSGTAPPPPPPPPLSPSSSPSRTADMTATFVGFEQHTATPAPPGIDDGCRNGSFTHKEVPSGSCRSRSAGEHPAT
mmetsp:Transcript_35670/g.102534  ORF Transcript_35670/g.102534 Transcript_35670/m.102534 type:complete len:282 (+) Transcript_35670:659-1504(+)